MKGGNDGSTLRAAVLPLEFMLHLLLSTALSHFPLADIPLCSKGEMLQGNAAGRLRLWGPAVGQATGTRGDVTVLRRSAIIITVFLNFCFTAAGEGRPWKCECCNNSSVQADENIC